MSDAPTHQPGAADLDAALAWYEALQDASAGAQQWQDFARWLEARLEHRLAFDRVEDLHATLQGHAPRLLALLAEARDPAATAANDNRRRWSRKTALGAAAALIAASLAVLWLPGRTWAPGQAMEYEAAPGHQRAVSLADGTHLDLSPGSRLEAHYDATSRRLLLVRGEILVQVGHDPKRPLMLLAGDLTIRDIGTVFDVALRARQIAVTVVSGQVEVAPGIQGDAVRNAVQVSAGQQFLHTPGAAADSVSPVDPATVLSWRNGFLTYQDARLSDVVADINRRFAAHVTLADSATGARRFSGVLKAESLEATLRHLSVLLSLPVINRGDGVQLGATNTAR